MKKRRKKNLFAEDSTPISAMIDIVFLLLIYFILTQKPIIEDTLLEFSPTVKNNTKPVSSIKNFGIIEVGEQTFSLDGQKIMFEQVEPCLRTLYKTDKDIQIIIFCSDQAKHSKLVSVLDCCRLTGIKDVSVMVK